MPDALRDKDLVTGPGTAAGLPGAPIILRLSMYGAVLILAVSAGFGVGRLTGGPDDPTVVATTNEDHTHGPAAPHDDTGLAPHVHNADGTVNTAPTSQTDAGGLSVSTAGLTLVPESTTFPAGRRTSWRFHIAGAQGTAITAFTMVHEKPLHLIVVRRDLSGYRHLHPTMAPDGTWSVDLILAGAGSWRAYADFTAMVGGQATPAVLGVDLDVPGTYAPVPLPAAANGATTDGFTADYEGTPRVGATQPLLVRVARATGGAAALEPYLGAYGHLVVLRDGDLGYVHVHPEARLVDGAVKFWLAAPGPGRYRMFFDFKVAGKVRTAAFTAVIRAG